MKDMRQMMLGLAGGLALAGAGGLFGQDWPQWRGPDLDGKAPGFTAPQKWPETLSQKWKTTVGLGDSSPALVSDKLYVFARQGSDEILLCLNAADGKAIWTNSYAAPAFSGPDFSQHAGPRSSPAVANGKVVTLGVLGVLTCVDAANGKLIWRNEEYAGATPRYHTGTSPLIVDDLCIAHLGKEGAGALVALDLATGKPKWKWAEEGPAYASPTVMAADGSKRIVTMTEKSIVAVGMSDGKLLWQTNFAPAGMNYNAATPIVDGQTVIYAGAGRGATAVKLEKRGDTLAATALWKNNDGSVQFNTPVLKNGLLFGLSARNDFFCISAQDGRTLWTAPSTPPAAGADAPGSGGGRGRGMGRTAGYASIIDGGSVLLALTPASQLIAFQPTEKAYTEIARIKVADSPVYAHPVVSGKRIFVKDQDAVTLWAIE